VTTAEHSQLPNAELHGAFRQVFANAAARLADAATYSAQDVAAKILSIQSDTSAIYYLSNNAPTTWTAVAQAAAPSTGLLISHAQAVGITLGPTTTSLVFVDLSEMTITFTPLSSTNKIRVAFNGAFSHSNNNAEVGIQVVVDGIAELNTVRNQQGGGAVPRTLALSAEKWLTLLAVSHTIKVEWKTNTGTATAVGVERVLIVDEYAG
jgi:hypothetical protein